MPLELLRELLGRRPFVPFNITQTDGRVFEIRHPEMIILGARPVTAGLATDPTSTTFDNVAHIPLIHIIRAEPLPVGTGGNGQAG